MLSTGGGALTSAEHVRGVMQHMLGTAIRLIVVTPELDTPDDSSGTADASSSSNDRLRDVYTGRAPNARLSNVILARLATGAWALPERFSTSRSGFVQFIQGRSQKNVKFGCALRDGADQTVSFPLHLGDDAAEPRLFVDGGWARFWREAIAAR